MTPAVMFYINSKRSQLHLGSSTHFNPYSSSFQMCFWFTEGEKYITKIFWISFMGLASPFMHCSCIFAQEGKVLRSMLLLLMYDWSVAVQGWGW